jgi:hypothetical protein
LNSWSDQVRLDLNVPRQHEGHDDLIQNATGNAMTTITVFGGTGFLGRRLALRLAAEGANVRVAVRYPDPALSALRTAGLNQITCSPPTCATKPRSPQPSPELMPS